MKSELISRRMICESSKFRLISEPKSLPAVILRSCHVSITPWRCRGDRCVSSSFLKSSSLWEYEKKSLIIEADFISAEAKGETSSSIEKASQATKRIQFDIARVL